MKKLIVCIADGAADIPSLCPEGTPLECAETPALDAMTRHSVAGLCYTIPKGFSPDSDVGNMSLLGYSPAQYHNGRAPIEAAALGVSVSPMDTVWRVTFSQAENDTITLPCASSLTKQEGEQLIATLNNSLQDTPFTFVANSTYRHLLIHRNGQELLTAFRQNSTRPFMTCGPHMLQDTLISEAHSLYPPELQVLMEHASQILADHTQKANTVWLWGEGNAYSLPNFRDTYGSDACIISGVPLLHGLGHMAGMYIPTHPEFTGLPDTNLSQKAAAAIDFLQSPQNTIAFIHVESPDHFGHAGDAQGKKEAIERIDAELLTPLLSAMPDAYLTVTCDHLTPASTKSHAHGAVPFILYHNSLPEQRTVRRFTENECKKGVHLPTDTLLLKNILRQMTQATAANTGLSQKK
ncbi:alkaline phosphatase family protein [Halodesulfovibrio sp.]|uniref:alkaline phosphatase family protein n=1 Tax=Halodesulfovibrio sp. TaxID=1912772 RepID=UPI0025C0835A|nr:alkaline phosphatase family protein [Halodesulfovibrio sp.]